MIFFFKLVQVLYIFILKNDWTLLKKEKKIVNVCLKIFLIVKCTELAVRGIHGTRR